MTGTVHTVWRRIAEHAGEDFMLVRGDMFTYEMFDNYLKPVGRV